MELKVVTKENCWPACIETWEQTVALTIAHNGHTPPKCIAVNTAGYDDCYNSCPMCEVYASPEREGFTGRHNDCKGCPIAHYYNLQYACEWVGEYGVYVDNGFSKLSDAERFLTQLKHIRRLDELGLIDYTHELRHPRA